MHGAVSSPHDLCRSRLAEHSERVLRLSRSLDLLIKVKRFFIFSVIGYVVFDPTAAFLLMPWAAFVSLAFGGQTRLDSQLRRARLAVEFYRGALARMEDRWIHRGDTGSRYRDAQHLFADDLDLFGKGSLFQFLCTARTSSGKDTLAAWLTGSEDAAEIQERQAAVRELRDCLELREQLAVLPFDARRFRPAALTAWGEPPDPLPELAVRVAGVGLAAAVVVSTVLWGGFGLSGWTILGALVLELGFFVVVRERLQAINLNGYYALRTLSYLSTVRGAVRGASFKSNRLSKLHATIDDGGAMPMSVALAVYSVIVQLPPLLLLVCQLVPRVDAWRRATAVRGQAGLAALGELEALASLAQYAFEQPKTTLPSLIQSARCFEAVDLAHPLIPREERVTNDVQLNESTRLLLVSGSNMSGKSTLLRTVGINAVLALCGGPVCAQQLRISPLSIGTAMRFQDSLEHRTSHFYAVITRLRAVMELQTAERPLLFLIDEILQGTNSRDRLAGAEAVVRNLVERGAIGLVTTHDLELTRIVDKLDGRAANVHFVDELVGGEIHFDYKMRPGVVQTSNALALMRGMGLDV